MPKASKDGVVEIDGNPFTIRAGEEYPERGKFRDSEQPAGEELPSPKEEEESGSSASERRARGAAPENR